VLSILDNVWPAAFARQESWRGLAWRRADRYPELTRRTLEHKIDVVMSMSDRISVMHFGSVIAEGTPDEIRRNAEVRRAYLGGIAAP